MGPETRWKTPYYLVAASIREAMLTFGERYEASILNYEPIAPFLFIVISVYLYCPADI